MVSAVTNEDNHDKAQVEVGVEEDERSAHSDTSPTHSSVHAYLITSFTFLSTSAEREIPSLHTLMVRSLTEPYSIIGNKNATL